ncbi:MAG: PAS domain S-box protein [Chloroflexales bacterium]|nr:PAS domain S-box protein [Chloroflexales bacterium]
MSSVDDILADPQRLRELHAQLDRTRDLLERANAERQRAERALQQAREAHAMTLSDLIERRQVEATLRRYERVVSATPDLISLVDQDYVYQMVNQTYLRLNNKTYEQLVGHTVPDLNGAQVFNEQIKPHLDQALTGSHVQYQAWFDYPGAGRRLMHITYAPYYEESGTITGVVVSGRDITEQTRIETQLREREQFIKGFAEASPALMYVYDPTAQRLRYASSNGFAALGYGEAELQALGAGLLPGLIHPEDLAGVVAEHTARRDASPPGSVSEVEYRIRHKDGSWRWLLSRELVYQVAPDGRVSEILGVAQDITERKRMERELHEQETRLAHERAFLASVLETLDEGVLVTDRRGKLLLCNQAMEQITGCAEGEARTAALAALFPIDERQAMAAPTSDAVGEYRARNEIRDLVRRDGEQRQVLVSQQWLIRDEQPLMLTSCRDVTAQQAAEAERRRFEQKLQEAQRLESLGVLAGGIAHDFNNLLAVILGSADLALAELSPETPAWARLSQIASAARQAADLTRQMLTYAGQGHVRVEPVALNEVIQNDRMLLEASVGKDVDLRYDLASQLPLVAADLSQVRQVLMNLVINASEAIGVGVGTITISTASAEMDAADLAGFRTSEDLTPGAYARLVVRDTGAGMDPAVLERIFDPFFTTKFMGRGLGLAVVLGIVQRHRGALYVESTPGQGAKFIILLPAAAERPAASSGPVMQRTPQMGGMVLVVDDEAGIQLLAADMLRRLGLTPLIARDGASALAEVRVRRYELAAVLLDLTMPGMDSVEVFDAIRRVAPGLPVIVMSGYSADEVARRFTGRGAAGFLQKPFVLDTVRALLGQALEAEDARGR